MMSIWHGRRKRTGLRMVAFCVVSAILAGCGGGSKSTSVSAPVSGTETRGVLRGSQQNPPIVSAATGTATATVNAAGNSIALAVQTTGLNNVTVAHIHAGKPGVNGPVIFDLFNAGGGAVFPANYNRTVTAGDFTAQPAAGIATFADAINAVLSGNAYLNIHTFANGGGELRAQLGPLTSYTVLNGANLPAPLNNGGAGLVLAQINSNQTSISLNLSTTGLTNAQAATINLGADGVTGPTIFTIVNGGFTGTVARVLTDADLIIQPASGINTFADAINAILSGRAYINVTTQAQAAGAIRGQITFNYYVANLRGANHVPVVNTTATGTARAALNVKRDRVTITIQTTGLTNVQQAHLHVGAANANGPVIFDLYNGAGGAFPAVFSKTLSAADLTVAGGINNFTDFVNALNAGNVYVNIHTQANPGGEIRGQLLVP